MENLRVCLPVDRKLRPSVASPSTNAFIGTGIESRTLPPTHRNGLHVCGQRYPSLARRVGGSALEGNLSNNDVAHGPDSASRRVQGQCDVA